MPADVGTAYVDIRPDMSGFGGRLAAGVMGTVPQIEGAVGNAFKRSFATIGAMAAGALGVSILSGAVSSIVGVGIEYERTLSVFKSVTQATEEQMAKTAEVAKALGNDIKLPGVSAAGAAAAMTELAKAGLSVEQSQEAAAGALALAIAAQTSEAEAAMITANALLTFGLEADQAIRVTDLLAGAANASSASMGDIAYGLQMAGAAMQGAGVPIEDTITALTMLANAGIRGSDAGTLLKTTVTRLTAPTDTARKKMEELGLVMFDADGKFVGMRSAVEQLDRALSPLSDSERATAVNTMFGADAMRFANIAAEQGVGKWDEYATAVSREGQAAELAAAQNVGLGGALDNLQSVAETVGLAIYERIQPALTAAVEGITGFIGALPGAASAVGKFFSDLGQSTAAQMALDALKDAFNNVKAALPPLVDAGKALWQLIQPMLPVVATLAAAVGGALLIAFQAVTAALEPVANVLRSVAEWLAEHSGLVYTVVGAVAAFNAVLMIQNGIMLVAKGAQIAYATVLGIARGAVLSAQVAMWLLNAAMTANPIGIIIALIVALVAGIVLAYKNSETFRNIVNGVWNAIKTAIGGVVSWITDTVWPALKGAWDAIAGAAQALWDGISAAFSTAVGIFQTVIEAVTGFVSSVASVVMNVAEVLSYPFRLAAGLIIAVVLWVSEQVLAGFQVIWDGITTVWNAIWGFLEPIVTGIRDTIVGAWQAIVDFVVPILLNIHNAVANAFNAVKDKINQVWSFISGITQQVWGAIWSYLSGVAQNIWNTISDAFNRVLSVVTGILTSVHNAVSGVFNQVVGTITGFAGRIWQAAKDVFNKVVEAVSGVASSLINAGRDLIQGFIDGIMGMARTLRNKVEKFIRDNVPGPVRSLLGISSPSRLFMEFGQMTADGLAIGISKGAGKVASAATELAEAASGAWDAAYEPFTTAITLPPIPPVPTQALGSLADYTAPGSGLNTTINVYPRQGQSEEQIAALVDARLGWTWETA